MSLSIGGWRIRLWCCMPALIHNPLNLNDWCLCAFRFRSAGWSDLFRFVFSVAMANDRELPRGWDREARGRAVTVFALLLGSGPRSGSGVLCSWSGISICSRGLRRGVVPGSFVACASEGSATSSAGRGLRGRAVELRLAWLCWSWRFRCDADGLGVRAALRFGGFACGPPDASSSSSSWRCGPALRRAAVSGCGPLERRREVRGVLTDVATLSGPTTSPGRRPLRFAFAWLLFLGHRHLG